MNKLQKVWNDLDKAYEKMERAIEILSKMDTVTTELKMQSKNLTCRRFHI